MADATCSERRPAGRRSAVLLTALLAVCSLSLAVPVAAQDDKQQAAGKRKTKRVKALSLTAQGFVLRITRILEKASGVSDEATELGSAAREAEKMIPEWRKQVAALPDNPELTEKKLAKEIAKVQRQIADGEKMIRDAPARIEKLQRQSLDIFSKAVPVLDEMRERGDRLQGQDRAAMWNYYGYVYAILERFKDARNAYVELLKEPDAPDDLKLQAMYAAAQLSMLLEEYARGVGYLERWFGFSRELGRRIRPTNYFLLAQGYFQLERYDDVLEQLDITLDITQSEGAMPMENWLRLYVATQFEKELYEDSKPLLELLVLLYPKREYWLQLQGVYGRLEQSQNQLNVLHLAWQQELFENENEFVALAQQLQAASDPYEAAIVLSDGMDKELVERSYINLKALGDTLNRAGERDRALEAYLEAAEKSQDGEMHYLSAVLLHLEARAEESLEQARQAMEKGDFAQLLAARILAGQNLLDLGKREEALEIFEKIAEEGYENRVSNWIKHVKVQMEAIGRMRESIAAYSEQEAAIRKGLRDDY